MGINHLKIYSTTSYEDIFFIATDLLSCREIFVVWTFIMKNVSVYDDDYFKEWEPMKIYRHGNMLKLCME